MIKLALKISALLAPFVVLVCIAGADIVMAKTLVDYHPNGKVRYKRDVNEEGILHGIAREYFETGILSAEKRYENGQLEGISKKYFPTGELMTEWLYKEGKRDGMSVGYYKSGRLKDKGYYINDLLEGKVFLFFPRGGIKAEMNFSSNRQDGISRTYYESRKVQFVYTHRKGQLLNRKTFNQDGKLELDQDFSQPPVRP